MPGDRIPHSALPQAEIGAAPAQLNVMIIYYSIVTDSAVYQFQVNQTSGQARITRWILKGSKGAHASTSMSVHQARKLAKQLQTR